MNRNELFRLQKAEHDAQRAEHLRQAKEAAELEGKETFDLDAMDTLWRDNPDKRLEAQGLTIPRNERIAQWSEVYYVQYPNIHTLSEFVAKMKESQVHGFFD